MDTVMLRRPAAVPDRDGPDSMTRQHASSNLRKGDRIPRHASVTSLAALLSGFALGTATTALLMRRRMRGVVQMASGQIDGVTAVSHEFCNAIGALLAVGENIRDGLVLSEETLRNQGTVITTQVMRLKALVGEIMSYAESSHGTDGQDIRELNVAEVIDDALCSAGSLLKQEQFTVAIDIMPGLPGILGDLSMLSRCLQNLITNAVKYSGESRWVGIVAKMRRKPRATESEIQISVQDHGIGIAEQDLQHIFEPFYRGHRNSLPSVAGVGLGLSITRRNAEACGGRVSVVSEEGVGSVFTLHFPLQQERSTQR